MIDTGHGSFFSFPFFYTNFTFSERAGTGGPIFLWQWLIPIYITGSQTKFSFSNPQLSSDFLISRVPFIAAFFEKNTHFTRVQLASYGYRD